MGINFCSYMQTTCYSLIHLSPDVHRATLFSNRISMHERKEYRLIFNATYTRKLDVYIISERERKRGKKRRIIRAHSCKIYSCKTNKILIIIIMVIYNVYIYTISHLRVINATQGA